MALICILLGVAPAWAEPVDISTIPPEQKVEVGTWAELKAAVEDSNNAGKVIVLTGNIEADKNNPIKNVGGAGMIIDGGGSSNYWCIDCGSVSCTGIESCIP